MTSLAAPDNIETRTVPRRTHRSWNRACLLAFGLLVFASTPMRASAQGCSQCTQAVGQTPPRTQSAYRKGIVLLVLAGSGVFASSVIVLRRFR